MAILATNAGGGEFKQLDPGTYIARCINVWSIGTQYNKWHDNWNAKVILRWEIPEEEDSEGKPVTISAFYTLSLHEKSNLYKHLVAWRGRNFTPAELIGFDLKSVLGAPCLLTVTHTPDGKQKVGGVSKIGKGMNCPEAIHATSIYDPLDDVGLEGWNALPEWVQKQAEQSRERMSPEKLEQVQSGVDHEPVTTGANDTNAEDDIPF
jgi:hypothetical protein|tara:strand:+ start:5954 stop:6574 length:621 start_codon:yes stop_codon:yes gene_type:complete